MEGESAYIRFVRELIRQLPLLKSRAGPYWPMIAAEIAPLLMELAISRGPDRSNYLAEKLYLTLEGTRVSADVKSMWRMSWAAAGEEVDPGRSWPDMHDALRAAALLLSRAMIERDRGRGQQISLPDKKPEPVTSPPPTSPGQEEEVFHYVLKGDNVQANRILVSSRANLIFQFSVPGDNAVAEVISPQLNAALISGLEMQLIARSNGPIAIHGVPVGLARFEQGRMLAPVSFSIEAESEPGPAYIQVDYYVRGERVHQSEIPIEVVPALSSDKAGLPALRGRLPSDFLASRPGGNPVPQHTVCLSLALRPDGRLSVTAVELINGFSNPPQTFHSDLDRSDIDRLLKAVQHALQPMYANGDAWGQIGGESDGGVTAEEREKALLCAVEAVALGGSVLHEGLREDEAIGKLLDYIGAPLREGCVLTIGTDNVFLPWEILYPKTRHPNATDEEKAADPVDRSLFWGARFAIETDLGGDWQVTSLREKHVAAGPRVSINVDPGITADGYASFNSSTVHRQWAETLQPLGALDGIQETCSTIRPVLLQGKNNASLIYLFCHGAPADAVPGEDALLYLCGDLCKVAPTDFKGRTPFSNAPIIFLNSCYAGTNSPFVTNQFLREFRKLGALGTIATSFEVPAVFAASFANEVVQAYIERDGSLAQAMRSLRLRHLDGMNPVPLLYTLQCTLYQPFLTKGENSV